MSTAREELKALLDAQPEDSSSEELVREWAFLQKIRKMEQCINARLFQAEVSSFAEIMG